MADPYVADDIVEQALAAALRNGGDFADLYAERVSSVHIVLSEDIIKEMTSSSDRGAGVRVRSGESTGYSFAESFEGPAVLEAARAASAAAFEESGTTPAPLKPVQEKPVPALETPPSRAPLEQKVRIVRDVNTEARGVDAAVKNVQAIYQEFDQAFEVANSEGTRARDGRKYANLTAVVTAVRGDKRHIGFRSIGGPVEFKSLQEQARTAGREAAQMALRMLDAQPAPAGQMPVVLCNGRGGGAVLFHEACGHALESDTIVQGASIFAGKRGTRIGSDFVNLYDDGTLDRLSGGIRFDDEGTPSQKTPLIESGTLVGYMCDLAGAKALGLDPTGNGRRQSFRHPAQPRMRVTCLAPGEASPEDLISEIDQGVYVAQIGGGGGEMSGSGFVFSALEAYRIEKGRITTPVSGVTLRGRGLDLLEGVDGVANDFAYNEGCSMCGKGGQWAFVSEGQATVRIRGLTVGGGGA
jgi:TldD protein